jgi:hypothetical protein
VDANTVGRRLCALNDISQKMLESLLRIEAQLLANNQKIEEALAKGDALIGKGDALLSKADEVNQRGDQLRDALKDKANAPPTG